MTAPTFTDGLHRHPVVAMLRRRGVTGRGVRVGLLDTPVGMASYFRSLGSDIHPLRTFSSAIPTHGGAVAAALLAVAPGVRVVVFSTQVSPMAAVARAEGDVFTAAWSLMSAPPSLREAFDRIATRTVVPDVGEPFGTFPSDVSGAHKVGRLTGIPLGPYRFPSSQRHHMGVSIAVGVAAGLAAALIEQGQPVQAALAVATSPHVWARPPLEES